MVSLNFSAGTIELHGLDRSEGQSIGAVWDDRTACHRVDASSYTFVIQQLRSKSIPIRDAISSLDYEISNASKEHVPRPYQQAAISAWIQAGCRGVISLPTGSGKTLVAVLGIACLKKTTAIIAPTLDLVHQWHALLTVQFGTPIGLIGGGDYQVEPITVMTYDSAYLHMDRVGDRFGLLVFDECHHLPSGAYSLAARFSVAPNRLGLTATPERADGREKSYEELIGPIVFRQEIVELKGEYLAEYEVIRIKVSLSVEDRAEYEQQRKIYRDYLRRSGVRFGGRNSWTTFIVRASQSSAGRRALIAHRRQKEIALAAPQKISYLAELIETHRSDRMLVFTADNASVYRISKQFLIPAITHQTRVSERRLILDRFNQGMYRAIVTSKVLNEGVDVPAANVAVILSGSGSIREHVQRLGRILRKQCNKMATLYELVTEDTAETYISERRSDHAAYANIKC